MNENSLAAKCYMDTVERLIGNDVPFRNIKGKKDYYLGYLEYNYGFI